ncbi:MAG: hypothetical protein JXB40_00835 [Candidatus Omnitrophica bacterium]|nr:hypothetical protein [Candidatus Omnitrophota bacterium]
MKKLIPFVIAILVIIGLIAGIFGAIALSKPVFKSAKEAFGRDSERPVAYEEVTEYDSSGNIIRTTRNYTPSK